MWSTYGLTTLVAFLGLSTFRKCESLRTEKLVEQENGNGNNAIYYRESMGSELVLCALKVGEPRQPGGLCGSSCRKNKGFM